MRLKVVVLTSPRTYSAAEDFASAFDVMRRGLIVGEPTGGSTGQPLFSGREAVLEAALEAVKEAVKKGEK